MNVKITKQKNNLIYIFFISVFFSGISIVNLGNFSLTVTYVISFVVFFLSLLDMKLDKISAKKLFIAVFFIVCVVFSSVVSPYPINKGALFQYIYWILFFLCVSNTDKDYNNNFKKYVNLFLGLSHVISIYAIYQFVAYNYIKILPFSEIVPAELLSVGYNTIQRISILGQNIYKAHAIYLEASTLSQMSAISIVFTISLIRFLPSKKIIRYLFSYVLALVTSLSGTGLMILAVYFIYQFLLGKNIKIKLLVLAISVAIMAVLLGSPIGGYIFNRFSELNFNQSINTYNSGYYRFILPFVIGGKSLGNIPFGYGAGNDDVALELFLAYENAIGNGYGKLFVEFGFLGLICIFLILKYYSPKKGNDVLTSLFIVVVMCNLVGMSLVKPEFWCFAILLKSKEKLKC